MEKFGSIPVIRHLEDVDNLKDFGRDGGLMPNQEDDARVYADQLVDQVHLENKRALLLLCSTWRRGVQTGQLIREQVKSRDPKIKTVLSQNQALSTMYEGAPNLPADYAAGEKFAGFSIGKQAFSNEVFGKEPNYLYRFGDPVVQEEGKYKYPELAGLFTEYGESYRDFMVRLLELVVGTAQDISRLNEKTKVVAITHSLQYQMFYDLQSVAAELVSHGSEFELGKLPIICWEKYKERIGKTPITYEVRQIDINHLCDEKVVAFLSAEIEYLKKLK